MAACFVGFGGVRAQLRFAKLAHSALPHLMFGGEVKIHDRVPLL
jgi:hypothetical protein